jgi:single-stranded DNA-specific DHH superfamily exonuclease
VPDRALHGYGLTPAIVELALPHRPDVLVTVDNGIASHAGVAFARAAGLQVLVTDHHLPALIDGAVSLPEADVIVNPNQPDCGFGSKCIAGVGVMFYVLLATRAEQRACGLFDAATQPRLDTLLDLVALGTVADVVKLDANNRRLVAQGLRRIRAGAMPAGIAALFKAAGDNGPALKSQLNQLAQLAASPELRQFADNPKVASSQAPLRWNFHLPARSQASSSTPYVVADPALTTTLPATVFPSISGLVIWAMYRSKRL